MRIIAGKHRGRVLSQFRGMDIRPTADRVKESLFQIIGDRLVGARVLDLFCGSGALGLESLSRGAKEVVFNDVSRESLAVLQKNLTALREEGLIMQSDYAACLMRVRGKFDVIFCDPPYQMDCREDVLSRILQYDRLAAGGIVIWESEREEEAPAGWQRSDLRRYGRTKIAFFTRSAP